MNRSARRGKSIKNTLKHEWTSGRPVTMRSATVTVEWLVTLRCVDTTAVILIAGQIDQKTAKINQSKRRQLEFIHSRLEQCGLGIMTWPMRL